MRASQFSLRQLLILMTVVSVLLSLLMTVVVIPKRRKLQSVRGNSNLTAIGMALHRYHDANGCLPPAYIADENGKPMHSWRVLLLPYLCQEELYKQYDFSESWDGPHNRLLAANIPEEYKCPLYAGRNTIRTSFVAVVGPQTAWPDAKSVRFQDFKDGLSNTITVVAIANSDINWMEPRDMTFEQAIADADGDGKLDFIHDCPYGSQGLFGWGGVESLKTDLSPTLFRGLLTINGGERVNQFFVDLWEL